MENSANIYTYIKLINSSTANDSSENDGQFHLNNSSSSGANDGQFRLTGWRGSRCCSGACEVSASDSCESPAECHRDVPASRSLELLLAGALDPGVARSCCTAPCWRPRRSAPLSPRATQRRCWEARSQEEGLSGKKIMNMITLCNAQLSPQTRVWGDKTRLLSRQNVCLDKHVFVVFVATKIISVAAPANDTQPLTPILNCEEQEKILLKVKVTAIGKVQIIRRWDPNTWKDSKERYLSGQGKTSKCLGVIPFVKLQNDTPTTAKRSETMKNELKS